ncbi:capsular polysaccharide biosynthesis protein [Planomicrobium soli]|uniref:Capsular polysaccharide biosynthesis protein n=1 Tax=Planomicrobium soli TaxID=1176648 RepID=A0A2P8GCE0_9BACL|nr:Wzz/FepE/Etk N-terminal domain-containing protein [Planomicrobium soli]PSL31639.1 capsular polysaccharide biosynthesis protein [Planomicrobium soli]
MSEEVTVLNILKNLRKRLSLIVSITFFSIATVWFLLEFIVTPDFEATTQIWVEEIVGETPEGNIASDQSDSMIIEAYGKILKSEDVLDATLTELNLQYSVHELHEMITITHASNPQVINITVSNSNSKEAVEIANTLTGVLQNVLMDWFETDNITVITQASEETVNSSLGENLIFDLGLAGAFGFIVGILVAFITEMLNIAFKNNERGRRRKKKANDEVKLQTVFK